MFLDISVEKWLFRQIRFTSGDFQFSSNKKKLFLEWIDHLMGRHTLETALLLRNNLCSFCKFLFIFIFSFLNSLDMNIKDFDEVSTWCKKMQISLVIVGPEDPLANGIADHLKTEGMMIFFIYLFILYFYIYFFFFLYECKFLCLCFC